MLNAGLKNFKASVDFTESPVYIIKPSVHLAKSPVDLVKSLVNSVKSLVNGIKSLVNAFVLPSKHGKHDTRQRYPNPHHCNDYRNLT